MKNKVGKILFLLLLICSSCSSVHQFSIDIQEPAPITLPVSAQNVLILNNTVTQPGNYGIDRTFDEKALHTNYPLSLDSMAWSAIDEIAGVLNESHFFHTIAVYKEPIHTKETTEWLSITDLSPEELSDFYDNENYDALLVVDRLLFSVKENVKKMQNIFSSDQNGFVDLRADGIITCSMYSYGREKPLTTFTVSDSLFTKSIVEGDSIIFFKEIPEYMIHELSRVLGNQAAKRFIPTWKTVNRLFFTGYNARMQEATSYAANRKWANAESIWTTELKKKTKPASQAKIALNLAVANEMQDKLDPAWNWAQKAEEYLKSANPNNNSQEKKLIDEYISELERRIQNNRLLDLQWGKE